MSEDKKPKVKKAMAKTIWSVQGLEKRCKELVESGALVSKDDGLTKICETVNAEFSDRLLEGLKLTQKSLSARAHKLIWTNTVQRELKRAIRHRIPLEEFRRQYFAYIPEEMWKKKAKFFIGLSNASASANFVAGVGRLITDELGPDAERFELPENDYNHPIEIPAGKDWNILIPNGANIGIIYDPNIEDNPLRRALSDAQKRNSVAVILSNVIDLYLKKTAGVMQVYRAQVSGLHIKLEHLPKSYRAEAARILKERRNDEVIYQNIAARFLGVLDALHKIFNRPKKRGPEFAGRVLYALGFKEEELINESANAELRYINILKQNELKAEIQVVNRLLAEAERDEEYKEAQRLATRQEQLSQQLAMAILTNISDEDRNRHRKRIRALLVKKLQEVIPNCTVISQGSAYLKVDNKIIKIHIPRDINVSDSHLSNYGDSYGAEVFTDTLADVTVSCHPYALNHRLIGREDSKNGQPVTKFVHVAPICVDDVFLRDQLKNSTKAVHPIQKCIFDPQFKPGVLALNCTNGIISADVLPVAKLSRYNAVKDMSNFAYAYPQTKYIIKFVQTDDHFGSRSKRRIWDPNGRIHLGITEATIEMMRREGLVNPSDMPVHFAHQMDDPTQGNHYETHNQPDPKQLPVIKIRRLMLQQSDDIQRAAEKGDFESVRKLTDEMNRVIIGQFDVRGLDWLFHQMMDVYDRQIEPNLDFYNAVLMNFERSKIAIRGISEITNVLYDTRDLGVINRATGNHFLRTVENKLTEGEFYARHLRAMLGQYPHWRDKKDFLEKNIVAPLYSNETFGWGTVKAPGGHEWGVRLHSSPARLNSWSDTLAAAIRNDLARGDDTYGLLKYVTLTLYGDKHFYCKAETARMIYFMCAAGTHTDLFGTLGFPPNNTGVAFVCLPADGPDAGPIIIRMIPHDYLRDWFADPRPFNWRKFLPEPV